MKNSFLRTLILALTLALVLCLSTSFMACGSVSSGQNSSNVNSSSESSSSLNEQSSSNEECEHQFVNEGGKDATCTENGYAILRCSLCGKVQELEVVNKGHNYVDGVCSVCGEVEDTQVATPNEYFEFTLLDNDTYEIKAKDVNNMPASVVIPSTYEGKPVTAIGEGAFYYKSLKSIEIPNSVTSIGDVAFGRCSSLTLIIIPDSVTSIGDYAFSRCSSLTSVVIPNSVTSIGEGAFSRCSSLSYNVADNLKYLGNKNNPYLYLAGTESTEITTAKINKNCKLIGETAFYGCSSLTSVEIPNSVTTIGEAAFSSCRSLTSIVIPDSVTEIEIEAFANCHSLTSIVIPNSVTSIGEDAFRGCYDLETVYYKGTQSEWDKITIGSSNSKLTNATRYYYSENEPSEEGNYWHYVDGEIVVW